MNCEPHSGIDIGDAARRVGAVMYGDEWIGDITGVGKACVNIKMHITRATLNPGMHIIMESVQHSYCGCLQCFWMKRSPARPLFQLVFTTFMR